jgi:hypothetical protein
MIFNFLSGLGVLGDLNKLPQLGDKYISPFALCCNLKTFSVNPENKTFGVDSSKKALYGLNNKTCELLKYANGDDASEYTILDKITVNNKEYAVTSISIGAFALCSSLKKVIIEDNIPNIDVGAFALCRSLKEVTIPRNVTNIDIGAFALCTSLESVTIKDAVTNISIGAFALCTSLKSVTIQDAVTNISIGAFALCTSLESVTIGDKVTNIDIGAFALCISLQNVTIGSNVTDIRSGAFALCIRLASIYFKTDDFTRMYLSTNSFYLMNGLSKFYLLNTKDNINYVKFNSTSLGYKNSIVTQVNQVDASSNQKPLSLGYKNSIVNSINPMDDLSNRNFILNNKGLSKSIINTLSDYYNIITNEQMQKQGVIYLKNKSVTSGSYINAINIITPTTYRNLIGHKITYNPTSVKYDIIKSSGVSVDTPNADWKSIPLLNTSFKIKLSKPFKFNNIMYFNTYISSNGSILFGEYNNYYDSILFQSNGIFVFYPNLQINPILCNYEEFTDYLGIYYSYTNLISLDNTVTNQAYIKLYFDTGKIEVNYINIDPDYYFLIGLSDGSGANYNTLDGTPKPVKYSIIDL